MAFTKITFFFQQLNSGWTETYYQGAVSGNLLVTFQNMQNVMAKRAASLGKQGIITNCRVSITGGVRQSQLFNVEPQILGNQAKASDAPEIALILQMFNAGNTKTKLLYLRGVYDDIIVNGGQLVGPGVLPALLDDFRDALIAQNMGWLGIPQRTQRVITAITQQPGGTVQVTCPGLFNIVDNPVGTKVSVRFTGISQPGNFNGVHPMVINSADQCTSTKRIAILTPFSLNGTASYTAQAFVPINGYRFLRVGERKVGRIFHAGRGRARVRPTA